MELTFPLTFQSHMKKVSGLKPYTHMAVTIYRTLTLLGVKSSLAYSRLIVESCFFSFFLLIDPYSHLRHWLPFFPHQTKELKHSIKQFPLQFRGRLAAVCFGLQVQNTPLPNGARQNICPYYFPCAPPPRRRHRRAAPLHFTPLSYFTASPCVKCRRKGAFPFSFFFLLLRRRLYSCWRAASYGC